MMKLSSPNAPSSWLIFLCLRSHAKTSESLTFIRTRERKYTVNVRCSVQYSLIRGVSKKFGDWYQKTNKTEDTNKLTLLAFKIIAILYNTLLETFIKLLEAISKYLFRNRSQNRQTRRVRWTSFCFPAWGASWKAHVLQTSLSLRFPHQTPVHVCPHLHLRYIPHPSHSRFYHPHNSGFEAQITKLVYYLY
jgi:hypothetical protein